MPTPTTAKLAILIDADNAQPAIIEPLLAEVAKHGTAHVKRAYGDWTGTALTGWKRHLLDHSVQPVQQFAYTTGKNATDAALIIDAMDLLYTGRLDGFCLVSSDSDFTRLAARLRESGLTVYGFGEHKTPKPFVAACDRFTYTENLAYAPTAEPPQPPTSRPHLPLGDALTTHLHNAIVAASDEDGWAPLATVGHIITKQHPDFDPRSYGHPKLSNLLSAIASIAVERRVPGDGKPAVVYVRDTHLDPTVPQTSGEPPAPHTSKATPRPHASSGPAAADGA